jgi:hypothetical protein
LALQDPDDEGAMMDHDLVPPVIRSLFDAMNAHDADAAAAAVDPSIEILVGPHVMTGVEVMREFASQEDPALDIVTTASSCQERDGEFSVSAHRVTRWRESGELSSEEDLVMTFRLTTDGRIGWARIA